jgi:hypothetical protein
VCWHEVVRLARYVEGVPGVKLMLAFGVNLGAGGEEVGDSSKDCVVSSERGKWKVSMLCS